MRPNFGTKLLQIVLLESKYYHFPFLSDFEKKVGQFLIFAFFKVLQKCPQGNI